MDLEDHRWSAWLISAKGDVEYGTALLTATRAEPLVRRAQLLVDLAVQIIRLGR